MSALADKIRKARQFSKEVAGWKLTLRRPTDEEAATLLRNDPSLIEVATRFVVGWSGVLEQDVIEGGSDQPVQFDADTWNEVVKDRPELWQPITAAVRDAWYAYNDKRDERVKN